MAETLLVRLGAASPSTRPARDTPKVLHQKHFEKRGAPAGRGVSHRTDGVEEVVVMEVWL